MKLGFLGTGKMATAIADGLIDRQVWHAEDMLGTDIKPKARQEFNNRTGVRSTDTAAAMIAESDVILLAVKPQDARQALADCSNALRTSLVISIAAGLPLSSLCDWIGHNRVVRVMPNTPATIGKGAAVYAAANGVTTDDRNTVERIFGAVGIVMQLDENLLDAVTAVSGSGPAYVFEMIQALADAAQAVGLPQDVAMKLVTQTLLGATAMVQQGCGTPDELRNAVTSPGGTTAAGLSVLEQANFRDLIKRTVTKARDRSIELGKT